METNNVYFQKRGTPIQAPMHNNPFYRDPQNGSPKFGKPNYAGLPERFFLHCLLSASKLENVPHYARSWEGLGFRPFTEFRLWLT